MQVRTSERKLKVALAGNPNIGKSTLFNALTGQSQHVGNWPGKTIERAEGLCRYNGTTVSIVDLPGTYSLVGGTPEEEIARDYIISEEADVTVVLVDGTNLERNLYLVLQAVELSGNVVVALNMMDEVKRRGWSIDDRTMSRMLGVPVVPISARRRQGIPQLMRAVMNVIEGRSEPEADGTGGPVSRPAADTVQERQCLAGALYERAEEITTTVLITSGNKGPDFTERLDAIITHRWGAFPAMLLILAAVFAITMFGADPLTGFLEAGFSVSGEWVRGVMVSVGAGELMTAAVVDGLIMGVGAVVSVMLPTMAIFFVLFALLEDSGLIPRIAFNMDRPMQMVGTQGKHCLSCLMGFGCNIPGVMSTRIMEGSHRLIAILTNSLVPCNGRLGIILPVSWVFFGRRGPLVVLVLIMLSILTVMGVSWILSRLAFKGRGPGFVLELPPYRCPEFGRVIIRAIREKVIHVLVRAAVIAAPMTLVIWAMSTYPLGVPFTDTYTGQMVQSLDAAGKLIGLDGKILTSALFAFPAKEIVIGALAITSGMTNTLDGSGVLEGLSQHWSGFTAFNFLIFYVFFMPCAYTLVTIYRETRNWSLTALGLLIPMVVAVVYSGALSGVGRLLGLL